MIIQRGKHHILNSGNLFFIEGRLAMLPEVESIDEPFSLDVYDVLLFYNVYKDLNSSYYYNY